MKAWIFDVDGVLTDPEKKISTPPLLSRIAKLLEQGDYLALNTGRSSIFIIEHILNPLSNYLNNTQLFSNLYVSCEMGNVVLSWNNTSWIEGVNNDVKMPASLIQEVKDLITLHYSENMFFDPKHTMISVEMKSGSNHEEFKKQEDELMKQVRHLLKDETYKTLPLKTHEDVIAVNIQFENSGKKLGAEHIKAWLQTKKPAPEKVYMFGDSSSDLEMAEVFEKQYSVLFVFVGKEEIQPSSNSYPITKPNLLYDRGTLEFLNSNS